MQGIDMPNGCNMDIGHLVQLRVKNHFKIWSLV